jgi:FkbM family methyltransferase
MAESISAKIRNYCLDDSDHSKDNSITILNAGVSDKEGKETLFICSNSKNISTFSSAWKERLKTYGYNKTEEVNMITLDWLVEKYGLPNYVKIDAEGYCYKIISGMTKPIPLLSIEPNPDKEQEEKVEQLLRDKGYSKVNMFGDEKNLFYRLKI